jgi:hypothetical protein
LSEGDIVVVTKEFLDQFETLEGRMKYLKGLPSDKLPIELKRELVGHKMRRGDIKDAYLLAISLGVLEEAVGFYPQLKNLHQELVESVEKMKSGEEQTKENYMAQMRTAESAGQFGIAAEYAEKAGLPEKAKFYEKVDKDLGE